jgi:ketol-acid reductoisomerase
VDSLLPYMHARDVAYMVDNCSITARLGARRWGPRFQAAFEQVAFPAYDATTGAEAGAASTVGVDAFHAHPVHAALAALAPLRPLIDISVA